MSNPLISIVIPVFNRANIIHYCIDSVINQKYNNWELLLIDDGSKDNSEEVCNDYVAKDNRIKYYYQTNQGAGPARNLGIEKATGDWITFIDSDDAIMPNHLSQLVEHCEHTDMVMINRSHGIFKDGRLVPNYDYTEGLEDIELSGNKNIIEYLYGAFNPYKHANFACWDKFFKMSVIKEFDLRYPIDVPTGQDQVFVVHYFKYTQQFYFSNVGTYMPTPMGNEGIEHLACRLRHPNVFFHCQMVNYHALLELAEQTDSENVRIYATNYILSKPFERILLPYTHWRNRRKLGKKYMLEFINNDFLPVIHQLESRINDVRDNKYRDQLSMILIGKSSSVYDYWYYHFLIEDFKAAIKRRWKKVRRL